MSGEPDNPRICLIGAGPVGSLLAASLLSHGYSFDWVVREEQRRKQLGNLQIQYGDGGESFCTDGIRVVASINEIEAAETLILAVKAQQVDPLLCSLKLKLPAQLLCVANGLQHGPFFLGLLYGGAYLDGATVVSSPSNRLKIGPIGLQAELSASQHFCDMLGSSFLSCEASVLMCINMWHKLALNCVVNPYSAIYDCPNGKLLELLQADQFLVLLTEVSEAACAQIEASHPYSQSTVREARRVLAPRKLYSDCLALIRSTATNSSSMREDVRNGRETELAALNFAVVKVGAAHGIACPANRELAERVFLHANRQHA